VAVFLLDGKSTEFSEIHDPIILYPGLPRLKFEVPKALLIGRLFAVIESDPAAFTTLARALGVRGLQILGPYNFKLCASGQLHPIHGVILSFSWHCPRRNRLVSKTGNVTRLNVEGRDRCRREVERVQERNREDILAGMSCTNTFIHTSSKLRSRRWRG
jgi:hypothetical protein